jgi:hypothetical protein
MTTAIRSVLAVCSNTTDSLRASNYPDTLRNMAQKPVTQDQTDRSRRWRVGITTRLDAIKSELEQLGSEITVQLATLTDRLAEQERQAGREQ